MSSYERIEDGNYLIQAECIRYWNLSKGLQCKWFLLKAIAYSTGIYMIAGVATQKAIVLEIIGGEYDGVAFFIDYNIEGQLHWILEPPQYYPDEPPKSCYSNNSILNPLRIAIKLSESENNNE